jgi:signal transduction histidine kinase
VNVSGKDNRVEIAVTDQGVGIPSNERRHVFDRFVRGSGARASNISGTGIGLAMAREIVQAHGGEIAVESQAGEGSTFRVLLPAFQNDL